MPGPEFAGMKKASGSFSFTSIFRYFLGTGTLAIETNINKNVKKCVSLIMHISTNILHFSTLKLKELHTKVDINHSNCHSNSIYKRKPLLRCLILN